MEEKEKPENYEIINDINKACLFLRTKKGNIEKVCFEEGKKLIKENLDIENLFVNSFIVGKNRHLFPTNKYVPISEKNRC